MLPSAYQLPAGVLLVVLGLVSCFAGYRLLRAVLTVYGFVLGAFFASTLVAPSDTAAILVALAVGGLLGALVLYAGFFVGVVLVGAGFGATMAHAAWVQWRGSDPGVLTVLFFGVAGAALAALLERQIVSVATAFLGAQTAVAGLAAYLARGTARHPGLDDVWVGHLGIPAFGRRWTFLAWVALGLVGSLVQLQFGTSRRSRPTRSRG
jgi:Domain of unknown function (DUF4203)